MNLNKQGVELKIKLKVNATLQVKPEQNLKQDVGGMYIPSMPHNLLSMGQEFKCTFYYVTITIAPLSCLA